MKKFVVIFIAVFLLLFFSFKEHPSATDFTIFEIVLLTHVVSLIFSVPIWCLVWLLSKVLSKPGNSDGSKTGKPSKSDGNALTTILKAPFKWLVKVMVPAKYFIIIAMFIQAYETAQLEDSDIVTIIVTAIVNGLYFGTLIYWLGKFLLKLWLAAYEALKEMPERFNKLFYEYKENPEPILVPSDKTQDEINQGIIKRSEGIFFKDGIYCTWCGNHAIVLQDSTLGNKVWKYRNKDGSRDMRRTGNTYKQVFFGMWQCPNCSAKTKTQSFLCSNPSFKSKINSSKLIKGGLGTRLSQDYYDDS